MIPPFKTAFLIHRSCKIRKAAHLIAASNSIFWRQHFRTVKIEILDPGVYDTSWFDGWFIIVSEVSSASNFRVEKKYTTLLPSRTGIEGLSLRPRCIGPERARTPILFYCTQQNAVLRTALFWVITQVISCRRFGTTYRWTLRIGLICCPETSVRNYRYSLCNKTRRAHFSATSRLKPEITHRPKYYCVLLAN